MSADFWAILPDIDERPKKPRPRLWTAQRLADRAGIDYKCAIRTIARVDELRALTGRDKHPHSRISRYVTNANASRVIDLLAYHGDTYARRQERGSFAPSLGLSACKRCGRSDTKHCGRGLCGRCALWARRKDAGEPVLATYRGGAWSTSTGAQFCRVCFSAEHEHHGRGLCGPCFVAIKRMRRKGMTVADAELVRFASVRTDMGKHKQRRADIMPGGARRLQVQVIRNAAKVRRRPKPLGEKFTVWGDA